MRRRAGDFRVAQWIGNPNSAMVRGGYDLYGYEPAVMGRYAQLMKRIQGWEWNDGEAEVPMRKDDPLFRLLRCRFLIVPQANGKAGVTRPLDTAPQALLTDRFEVQPNRDAVYAVMQTPDVATGAKVILETAPEPAPTAGTDKGTVQIVAQTTDSLTIEAQTSRPMLLLITDAYSKYWRATALPGSSQTSYTVLPADYALRAIPLGAGTHRLRLDYAPPGYFIGRWISLLGVGVCAVLGIVVWRRSKRIMPLPEMADAESLADVVK